MEADNIPLFVIDLGLRREKREKRGEKERIPHPLLLT